MTTWWLCLGCGNWQQVQTTCQACNSGRMADATFAGNVDKRTGKEIDGSAIRVLIDLEARPNGSVDATRLHTERLALIRHDQSLLQTLKKEVLRLVGHIEEEAIWNSLRAVVHTHVLNSVDRLLRPRWPGGPRVSEIPVEVTFRLFNLTPTVHTHSLNLPWLEIVSLYDALHRLSSNLDIKNISFNLSNSVLSLDEDGNRLRLALTVPVETMVTGILLCLKTDPSQILARFDTSRFLERDREYIVLDERISAPVLRVLSRHSTVLGRSEGQTSPSVAELRVQFFGLPATPLKIEVPCGNLGQHDALADVFLDFGSTATKYVIRIGDKLTKQRVKSTRRLVAEWSLPPYNKEKLLNDSTGAEWSKWITELLPALRRYVAREHHGYLRSIHLTLPQSGPLDVSALSRAFAAQQIAPSVATVGLDHAVVRTLSKRAEIDTVGFVIGGQAVFLTPEHEALAHHYLPSLRALYKAASEYHKSYTTLEEERAHQAERQRVWNENLEKTRKAQVEFDNSFFLWRLFNTRPIDPTDERPVIVSAIESPAAWMQRLVKNLDLMKQIVILDAGGYTLDIAVLESDTLVAGCSRSNACGGEAVSRKLAERLGKAPPSLEDGTRWKAELGTKWEFSNKIANISQEDRIGRSGGREQRAYIETTWDIYSTAITELASTLAKRWKSINRLRCTILLTGGASRNPHFQELVVKQIAKAGIEADVVDARRLKELLVEARAFKHPLSDLNSPSVNLFTTVHDWAHQEIKGSDWMIYDRYAVVGGLLAGESLK